MLDTMASRLAVLSFLIAVALTGCASESRSALPGLEARAEVIVTPDPNATATPTPFLPMPLVESGLPTPTASPTPAPSISPTPEFVWGDFPAPIQQSATEIPPPASPVPQSPEVMNVILLGSDQRPSTGGYRTDTIIILSLDSGAQTATMVSIPRDLYVYIPGWRMDRINTADVRGGPEMTALTIRYNFGIEIHHWARIDFSGFMGTVDTLGGITVQSTGYLTDECGGKWWKYVPGTYHMDGFEALCYVRMRKATGDFDRMRRQQEVIRALFNKVISLEGLTKIPQLYNQFISMVQTDLGIDDILGMIPLGVELSSDTSRIRQYSIDLTMTDFWRVPSSGASVLLPDREAIETMLNEALGGADPDDR